jgi:hypothetical protein
MTLDRRITGGLAWAGLLLVIGVPSADALTSLWSPETDARAAVVTPEQPVQKPAQPKAEPVAAVKPKPAAEPAATVQQVADVKPEPKATVQQVAEVKPVAGRKPQSAPVADPVDRYLASGKKLPSYISDGGSAAAETDMAATPKPAPAQPSAAPETDDISVASITPQHSQPVVVQPEQVAPIPMPASMRPHPRVVVRQPETAANDEVVGPEELRDWESGPLSEFRARRQQRDAGGSAYIEYDAGEPGPVILRYDSFGFVR